MPRQVDHAARREEIVSAVFRLVARQGFAAVTMRQLAQDLGVANGALARYFPTKASILKAAFERAFTATNERAEASIGSREGLEAFELLCMEIMPLDEVRLAEARVVIGFWDYAASDQELAEVHDAAMRQWREEMEHQLRCGQAAGEVRRDMDLESTIDLVIAALLGLQVSAIFSPAATTPQRQHVVLAGLIADMRSGSS